MDAAALMDAFAALPQMAPGPEPGSLVEHLDWNERDVQERRTVRTMKLHRFRFDEARRTVLHNAITRTDTAGRHEGPEGRGVSREVRRDVKERTVHMEATFRFVPRWPFFIKEDSTVHDTAAATKAMAALAKEAGWAWSEVSAKALRAPA